MGYFDLGFLVGLFEDTAKQLKCSYTDSLLEFSTSQTSLFSLTFTASEDKGRRQKSFLS